MRKDSIDLTGRRFGRLIALHPSPKIKRHWACRCDCGNLSHVRSQHLRDGHTLSCGCLRIAMSALSASVRSTTHGHSRVNQKSPEYNSWQAMRKRCMNPNDPAYPRYGGRGIQICQRWNSFECFLFDMGPRPDGLQIERINNNLGYSPENCKWATPLEQSNNKRNNRNISWNGKTLSLSGWARETGLSREAIKSRINEGWPIDRALSQPVRQRRPA